MDKTKGQMPLPIVWLLPDWDLKGKVIGMWDRKMPEVKLEHSGWGPFGMHGHCLEVYQPPENKLFDGSPAPPTVEVEGSKRPFRLFYPPFNIREDSGGEVSPILASARLLGIVRTFLTESGTFLDRDVSINGLPAWVKRIYGADEEAYVEVVAYFGRPLAEAWEDYDRMQQGERARLEDALSKDRSSMLAEALRNAEAESAAARVQANLLLTGYS